MSDSNGERRLAAIMFTDMVGYSSLSQHNEALALELLKEHREVMRAVFPRFGGREVKTLGDGFLLEFPSALDAVQSAVEIQEVFHRHNASQKADRKLIIRIGIHVGDVVVQDADIYGDGVNIAARIEPLAPPGGICISSAVYEQVHNKLKQPFAVIGPAELKNIRIAMVLHRVILPWERESAIAGKLASETSSPPAANFHRAPDTPGTTGPPQAKALVHRLARFWKQWWLGLGWRGRVASSGAMLLILGLAATSARRTTPEPLPAPSQEQVRQVTPADRINYMLAKAKWVTAKQEISVSETANKKEAVSACRSLIGELRSLAFDDELIPHDFQQTYFEWIGANDEAIDLLEQQPDIHDTWEVISFVVNAGWNYAFQAGDPQKTLKSRAQELGEQAREILTTMDQIAARHGARTDWDILPRINGVAEGSAAERAGIKSGDFFYSVDGVTLYRKIPSPPGDSPRTGVFLTRIGFVEVNIAAGERFGVSHDTIGNQPPIIARLEPFAIYNGYYLILINSSTDHGVDDVVVTYSRLNGETSEQPLGRLAPKECKTLDPSKVGWTIEPTTTIGIKAPGYSERPFDASKMTK